MATQSSLNSNRSWQEFDIAARDAQARWETEMVRRGVQRYRDELDRVDLAQHALGEQFMRCLMGTKDHQGLVNAIQTYQDVVPEKALGEAYWTTKEEDILISALPADVVAFLTLRCVLSFRAPDDGLWGAPLTAVQLQLAKALRDEMTVRAAIDRAGTDAGLADVADKIKKAATRGQLGSSTLAKLRKTQRAVLDLDQEWPIALGLKAAAILLGLAEAATRGAVCVATVAAGGRTQKRVILSDEAKAAILANRDRDELTRPYLLPMIAPPLDWRMEMDASGKTRAAGGYVLLKNDLVRHSVHRHTAAHPEGLSQAALRAINSVQATPWRINGFILETAQAMLAADHPMIPQYAPKALPPKMPDADFEALGDDGRRAYLKTRQDIHKTNSKMFSDACEFMRKIGIAEDLKEREAIWFPHFFDFRLRMYPLPQDLSPQGDGLSQSLLHFAEGKRLGTRGLYWLAVRIAGDAGQDKLPFDDRVRWVLDHESQIIAVAADPLANTWWTEQDSPWRFLAGCHEWAQAHTYGGRAADFVSHLSVPMDGSVNGCQHLSMMGRDPIGAAATNCRNLPDRRDLYQAVADRVKARVDADDAGEGDAATRKIGKDGPTAQVVAALWVGRVSRNTVKRAVMTTPYGVTTRGITEFQLSDGHVNHIEDRALKIAAARYMQQAISAGLDEAMENGRAIMGYLQDVAKALADHQIPFRWQTPNGAVCWQTYRKLTVREVDTSLGRLKLWREDDEARLDANKMALAAAPNVIHSLDGCMLQNTVNALTPSGVRDFHMIHDSYGTHACDVDRLRDVIRQQAYAMYRGDWLAEFQAYVADYAPGVDLPDPPQRGSWDVAEVLQSEFFFS
ncbi:DNA-directed RNA polymerase [Nitrospirillum iridis]|uniref:DNA-directed RNA polymerase n=1 Tax=Nitrospirillum iridis TaxID=765888 RepID=A0A7X0AZM5_9PROT|nr:DNA-directed RNA polymerase [Nitrospirillum iridis]MBB6253053.1 DNA-directed RNA polymerase [Nitrospirillum iridis]